MNVVYLDWEHDVRVVVRRIRNEETQDKFIGLILVALEGEPAPWARAAGFYSEIPVA